LIEISDESSLDVASDLLHDAVFSARDIEYDERQRIFRLSLWREVGELARSRRILWVLNRIEMPLVRADLEMCRVLEVRVTGDTGFDRYTLNAIHYDNEKRMLQFEVIPPLRIAITIDILCGALRDIGDPRWEGPNSPAVLYRIGGQTPVQR
jgi:hypothetical protein